MILVKSSDDLVGLHVLISANNNCYSRVLSYESTTLSYSLDLECSRDFNCLSILSRNGRVELDVRHQVVSLSKVEFGIKCVCWCNIAAVSV